MSSVRVQHPRGLDGRRAARVARDGAPLPAVRRKGVRRLQSVHQMVSASGCALASRLSTTLLGSFARYYSLIFLLLLVLHCFLYADSHSSPLPNLLSALQLHTHIHTTHGRIQCTRTCTMHYAHAYIPVQTYTRTEYIIILILYTNSSRVPHSEKSYDRRMPYSTLDTNRK